MAALDDLLLPVMLQQQWLVTTNDVLRAGGTEHQIARRIRDERWERIDRSLYRPTSAPHTWESEVLAPILAVPAGIRALASDRTAAALHGVPGFARRGRPELSVDRAYNLRRPGVRVRTSNDLDRCGVVWIDGVPTTDLARTMLDLGRSVSDQRLLRAIEWSRRERSTTWSDLIAVLARHARRGRGGIQRLRRVIVANAHREAITDSDLELLVLGLLIEHGLPEPVLHHRIYDGERLLAEIDLAYPAQGVAIEVDGQVHLREDVWNRDLPRQNFLVLEGWTILRFNRERILDHPSRVVSDVRAALRRAGTSAA